MGPFSKSIVVVLVLTLSVIFYSSYKSKAQSEGVLKPAFQGRERAIVKKTDFNPPVSIKAVKTKGRSIAMGKKFNDDDDWLKGLAILVSNGSDKTIVHIGIEMLFRPVAEPKVLPAGWFLNHGPNPFLYKTNSSVPASTVPSVLPGNEIELKLSDAEFENLKLFLKEAGFPDKLHLVEIRVSSIGFADGTAWFGKMLKRDSNSPSGWTLLSPSSVNLNRFQSPRRNERSVNSFFDSY